MGLIRGILIFSMLCTPEATAQSRDQLRDWVLNEWKRAQTLPDLGRYGLSYTISTFPTMSERERASLDAQVRGKPEHPRRWELETEVRRARLGPDVVVSHFFSDGQGWRYGFDFGKGVFTDSVFTVRRAWRLTHESIAIIDPTKAGDPVTPEQFIRSEESVFWYEIGCLLYGGFSLGHISGVLPGEIVAVGGDRWILSAATSAKSDDGQPLYAVVFEGRWDDSQARGFVERIKVTHHAARPAVVGSTKVFLPWRRHDEIGYWITDGIEERSVRGVLEREIVLKELVVGSPSFDHATRIPSVGAEDVMRGKIIAKEVADYRVGEISHLDSSGNIIKSEAVQDLPSSNRAWLVYLGWSLAGAVFVLSYAWIRSRRMSSH